MRIQGQNTRTQDLVCRHTTLALVGCMAFYLLVSIAGMKTQCWHQLCAFAWFKTLTDMFLLEIEASLVLGECSATELGS